jgi:hypothetical protein
MKNAEMLHPQSRPLPTFAVLLAYAILLAAPVWPDVPRPFDERATARLIEAEVLRHDPDAEVSFSLTTRQSQIGLFHAGVGRGIFVDEIHQLLREATDGAEREAILQAFVRDMLQTHLQRAAADASEVEVSFELTQILPVLRTQQQIAYPNGGGDSYRAPAFGGLIQCWVIYEPQRQLPCFATWQARPLGLGKLEITALGLDNLAARQGDIEETFDGRVRHLTLGPRFTASLMLSTAYWQERATTGTLVAAIPTDGDLLWIQDATDAEVAALRQRVRLLAEQAERGESEVTEDVTWGGRVGKMRAEPLSTDLYRWNGSGWEILPE